MGTSWSAAADIEEQLRTAGIRVTRDPRSANPPCILLTMPARTYDLNDATAYTGTWALIALVPGPANADAWVKLDDLVDDVVDTGLPVQTVRIQGYAIDELGTLPAAVIELEGIVQ